MLSSRWTRCWRSWLTSRWRWEVFSPTDAKFLGHAGDVAGDFGLLREDGVDSAVACCPVWAPIRSNSLWIRLRPRPTSLRARVVDSAPVRIGE